MTPTRSSDAPTPRSTRPSPAAGTASNSPPKPPSPKAYLAWAIVCLVWGTTYLAIRVAIETIPPFLMTGIRWTAGGLLLSGLLAVRRVRFPHRASWKAHALLGVLLIGFGNGAVVWAEQTVPSGLAALLIAVTPFWMMGVERFTGKSEPLTAGKIAGLIVDFGGVMLLVWPQIQSSRSPGFLAGVLATQVAAIGWSIGSNLSRLRSPAEDLLAAAAMQMVFGGLFMLVLSLLLGESASGPFSARSLLASLYLLFIGSIVAYSAYAYALRHLPLTTVSMYAYVTPVIAVVLGTVVLNEPFSGRILVASALVLVSVGMVRH